MIYTPMTNKAMQIAYEAHYGQKDLAGAPYIFHPIHLAEQMDDEDSVCVALLHDVVEDTEMSLDELKAKGFSDRVLTAIGMLTHDKSVPYMEYIRNISRNPLARKVKLADLNHNSDLSRLPEINDKALRRLKQYRVAIELLEHI